MATYHIEPERRTLHGHFSRELAPGLTIDPGDTVCFRTLDAGWGVEPVLVATRVPAGVGTPRGILLIKPMGWARADVARGSGYSSSRRAGALRAISCRWSAIASRIGSSI